MARNVMTIPQNYSVITATNIFKKYHFGRIPVVKTAQSLEVVGIVTYGDILSHLLMQVNAIAEQFEAMEAISKKSDQAVGNTYRFEIVQDNFDLAGVASTTIKKHLHDRGIAPETVRRIAIICYEAEMNVIIHSLGGNMEVQILEDSVRIHVTDEGPGIPDTEKAMEPGFTTANEKIRALGFGAGLGLPNMKKCADEFSIRSSMGNGTEIEAIVYTGEKTAESAN
jgi:anti-sigma regulatory factor (Ser/Thr protein kinase)